MWNVYVKDFINVWEIEKILQRDSIRHAPQPLWSTILNMLKHIMHDLQRSSIAKSISLLLFTQRSCYIYMVNNFSSIKLGLKYRFNWNRTWSVEGFERPCQQQTKWKASSIEMDHLVVTVPSGFGCGHPRGPWPILHKAVQGNHKSHVLVYNPLVAIQFIWSNNKPIETFKQGCCFIFHLICKLNEKGFFDWMLQPNAAIRKLLQ